MKVLTLLLVFSSFFFDYCNGNNRIFNGVKTTIEKHPYQVALMVELNFEFYFICGGSIINNNTIVTAAHCIEHYFPTNLYIVKVGSTKYYNGEDFRVKKIIKHPDFDYYLLTNDIAILKLEKFLSFDDKVQPIELTPKNSVIAAGTKAVTSGWGHLSLILGKVSPDLQELEVTVLHKSICQMYNQEADFKFVCALNKGKSVCSGDSGGPLVVNGKLVGITSYIFELYNETNPYFFTNVALMRDFIDENI